ncbi:MAG TPA: DUF4255 domain-containing protein [Bacteroidales bacterium]|nr:DUF4255 domain-containing protein [Bacteroidales bacterium]HPS17452.1 DUF4255 domain-containing protein [Bacteroidales bacterium]
MIDNALTFIKKYVSEELNSRLGAPVETKIDSISKEGSSDSLYITLINIEEEKFYKNQNHYRKENVYDSSYKIVNPEIKLNLYILFSAQKTDYTEALKQISHIITIFQGKNVFEKDDFPKEITNLESLIIELYSLSFEQNNSLWQTMGSKIVPSVLYKVKLLSIQDNKKLGDVGEVRGIGFDILRKS